MLLQTLKIQQIKMWSDKSIVFLIFIQPIIFILLFGYMHRATGHQDPTLLFAAFLGVGQMSMWNTLLYSGGVIVRHEFNRDRTIFNNMVSSSSLLKIWSIRLMVSTLLSTPAIVISVLSGMIFFDAYPVGDQWGALFVGLLSYLLSLYAIGLPLIMVLFLATTWGGKILQTITYPMFLLSGMIVSVDYFPPVLRNIAYFFPITWSTHWMQEIVKGLQTRWIDVSGLIGVSAVYLIAAALIFKRIEQKVRLKGDVNL